MIRILLYSDEIDLSHSNSYTAVCIFPTIAKGLCAKGWQVCNPRHSSYLKLLTWEDASRLDGCYAYNAANTLNQCARYVSNNAANTLNQCTRYVLSSAANALTQPVRQVCVKQRRHYTQPVRQVCVKQRRQYTQPVRKVCVKQCCQCSHSTSAPGMCQTMPPVPSSRVLGKLSIKAKENDAIESARSD